MHVSGTLLARTAAGTIFSVSQSDQEPGVDHENDLSQPAATTPGLNVERSTHEVNVKMAAIIIRYRDLLMESLERCVRNP
ncbi:hypothetical protein ATANTOWER_003533 [Ataeniobius toweri]|uniref:Uncharacterized protein n=1 Tax=Ataeniobius toweri TaxID=208326 RepID=A0ABU7B632_9TELE|nr:hypothetical protein [Ataeniobius toweri]